MGSTGPTTPIVELDTTLRDLYAIDNCDVDELILVYTFPSSSVPLTANLPLSTTFPFQGPRATFLSRDVMARGFLLVGPVSQAFVSGSVPVMLFDLDPPEYEDLYDENKQPMYRTEAMRVISTLHPTQRPSLSFVSKPADIEVGDKKLVVLHPLDGLTHLPHAIDPYLHYELQSKSGLQTLGLPTPETEIIEAEILQPNQAFDETVVDQEVHRMMGAIRATALPVVIKLPQAFGGQGVFIVKNESERDLAIGAVVPEIKKMIQQRGPSNKDLKTASIVIQEYIESKTSICVNIFVTKSGKAIFIGTGTQYINEKGLWNGNYISYPDQGDYQETYATLCEQLATALHTQSYYGPVGFDVISDTAGKHYIIDLNARVTASYQLGLMKGHFHTRRGFSQAAIFYPLGLTCTYGRFEAIFKKEIQDGQIVICAWTESRAGPGGIFRFSLVSIIVGGEDQGDLAELVGRVNRFKIEK